MQPAGVNNSILLKRPYYKKNKLIFENAKTKCSICGEDAKCCLEFHHVGKKRFNISHSLKFVTPELLLRELSNTVCICANCHRKLHAGLLK